jgi:hypothetical protein
MSRRQQSKRARFAHRAKARRHQPAVTPTLRLAIKLPPSVDSIRRAAAALPVDDLVMLPDGRMVPAVAAAALRWAPEVRTRYVCYACGAGGAHPTDMPAPTCHNCGDAGPMRRWVA